MELNVASYNVKNNGRIEEKRKEMEVLRQLLTTYQIDIAGLQEVTPSYEQTFRKEFKDSDYQMYGNYRWGTKLGKLPGIENLNESNPIVTRLETKGDSLETHGLPWFQLSNLLIAPADTFIRRIYQKGVFVKEGIQFTFINTHLAYNPCLDSGSKKKENAFLSRRIEKLRLREFEYLFRILDRELSWQHSVIMTGEFNVTNQEKVYDEVVMQLCKMGIYPILHFGSTCKTDTESSAPRDNIFISEDFGVVDKEVISTPDILKGGSDHNMVYTKIRI